MNKFYIKTYGCQYNEWDSARLAFLLKNIGLIDSPEKEALIIFVLNCSVRQTSVDRALGKIENWQDKKVVVTGCLLDEDKKQFTKKGVEIWDGKDLSQLTKILKLNDKDQIKNADFNPQSNFIPIMKGCNNFCSYCAVPYTRGRESSRSPEEIIKDAKELIASDRKEIWLLGQNVNSYEYDFAKLLKSMNNLEGGFTIYFTSNHPKDMSDEIISAIAKLPKVAKLIHLPVQSGSNRILKLMNRPYTKEQYLELVDRIKKMVPGGELTTDTIIGFPTETEEDFQETVELIKEVGFKTAYNNKYSPRKGTKAFDLSDDVPWKEKERRWRILNDLVYHRK